MNEENFKNTIKCLSSALIDDFRGFLAEGSNLVEVPDDMLHFVIALQEMSKVPGWKYEGQNTIVDYMQAKKAIYITRIPIKEGKYQRTVGYLTDAYLEFCDDRGIQKPQYEVIKQIALGMGYDVDEYTLQKTKTSSFKNPVSITTYKGKIRVQQINSDFITSRHLSDGDKPVFSDNGDLMGFISNGRFVSKENFRRYATKENPGSTNDGLDAR